MKNPQFNLETLKRNGRNCHWTDILKLAIDHVRLQKYILKEFDSFYLFDHLHRPLII